jgi:hypothetical protein
MGRGNIGPPAVGCRRKCLDPGRWAAAGHGRLIFTFRPGFQVRFHGYLVELLGFALDDLKRPLGAFAETGAQAVAQVVRDNLGLAVDNLQCALGTGNHAVAAAVAAFLVDLDNLSFDFRWAFDFKFAFRVHAAHLFIFSRSHGDAPVVIQVIRFGLPPDRFPSEIVY